MQCELYLNTEVKYDFFFHYTSGVGIFDIFHAKNKETFTENIQTTCFVPNNNNNNMYVIIAKKKISL